MCHMCTQKPAENREAVGSPELGLQVVMSHLVGSGTGT